MRTLAHRILKNLSVPVGWTILTIVLLCMPGSTIPSLGSFSFEYLDKVVHFILFGALVFFWSYYLVNVRGVHALRQLIIWITLAAIILGICLEFVQFYFIPNRDFDPRDIVANSLGAVVIAGAFMIWTRRISA